MKKFFAILTLALAVGSGFYAFSSNVNAAPLATQSLVRSGEEMRGIDNQGHSDSCNNIIITRCKS